MQREKKLRALCRILGEPTSAKGAELLFFCPRHVHHKKKLGVDLATDKFYCWVCGFRGKTIVGLLRLGGPSAELTEYVEELAARPGEKSDRKNFDVPVLPTEFFSLTRSSRSPFWAAAWTYLRARGADESDVFRMKLGYCEEGPYRQRIIFPSFDGSGQLNFFVGRAFVDWLVPKYKLGNFSRDVVFNEYSVDWRSPVVLVEGPFDALKAGWNAVPLLGSSLDESSCLFKKIVLAGTPVYFAMDADAFTKQLRIIDSFLDYGVESFYVDLRGKKDVGEMTKGEFIAARRAAVPVESKVDLLKLRIKA